jgi:hypothetical protein
MSSRSGHPRDVRCCVARNALEHACDLRKRPCASAVAWPSARSRQTTSSRSTRDLATACWRAESQHWRAGIALECVFGRIVRTASDSTSRSRSGPGWGAPPRVLLGRLTSLVSPPQCIPLA